MIGIAEKRTHASRGLPPAEKADLASLVSYQLGSVVSRTLLDDPAGTVTLFAFDEGQGLSEHTTPYEALLHLLDGRANVTIAGQESELTAGDGILLPAGKPHAVRARSRCKILLTMIRSSRGT